ncbi:MAG: 4Fe-4S binding protein [Mogibacterium sp.]|nr:4Fe-4S binding protein [Mogibacterium sp.]
MKLTREIKRKIIQIAAFGYSNPHLQNFAGGRLYEGSWKQFCNPGMNCYSCPAAGLACPIGAMQAGANSADYRFGFYATGMVLALGVILGRVVCGFLCPFGLVQELLHKIPSPKLHLPKWMTYIKYGLLAVFVILLPMLAFGGLGVRSPSFCKFICPVGIIEGGLPILATHPELRAVVGWLFGLKSLILIVTIAGSVLVSRFFCKLMCPLGAIYGLLNPIAVYRMDIDSAKCVSCGVCAKVCPMDVNPTLKPNSAECIRCGKCITACPTEALSSGFKIRSGKVLNKTEVEKL